MSGSTPNPYQFGGAWGYITDPSGMVQLGERFYWAEVGRFLEQGPAGDGMNWYAYVGSRPVTWVDPEGLRLVFYGDRQSINQALAYLARVPNMKKLINDLRYSRKTYRIVACPGQPDKYDPSRRTIHWDPRAALRTTEGGRQSPALGLGHELAHAHGPWQPGDDPRYEFTEEHRVIVHFENPTAVFLREDVRHDHLGTPYVVAGPLERDSIE